MTVYSVYIFDRHTECIYHRTWLPPSLSNPSATPYTSIPATATPSAPAAVPNTAATSSTTAPTPPPKPSAGGGGGGGRRGNAAPSTSASRSKDTAKLVFGTVFSLRNMVRKLGGEDDAFVTFRTAEYKLHYYETPSNLRLVMLTDTATMSMRNVLHQIYINLWVEYVVKNPLSPAEHKGGEGVKNELFELGLDQFVRTLG